jgi:hypothetical protein
MGPYQGFTILLSRSRGQKWIQDLSKPYKYPSLISKRFERKLGKKKKSNINKKYKGRGPRVKKEEVFLSFVSS